MQDKIEQNYKQIHVICICSVAILAQSASIKLEGTALNYTLAKTMSSAIAMHLLDNARPMNERLEAILGELGKDNLFKETHLSVEQILVHPRNSFNLGLNPWHVHTIGAEVQKTGAMKEALRSVAIELSPHEEIKKMQIAFNERLVEGLMENWLK